MSDPDNFLTRWSRRKRAAAEDQIEPDPPVAAQQAAAEQGEAPASTAARLPEGHAAPRAPAEFDPSSLPPIESIGPETDVTAFLRPGVPAALRHAALRRAWSSDPSIRDFKGLAENDWDFNDPNAMPGFGKLDADFDTREMVARIFGETTPESPAAPEPAPAADGQAVQQAQESEDRPQPIPVSEPAAVDASRGVADVAQQDMVQREENFALQQVESTYSNHQNKLRRHGGALPQIIRE